MPWLCGYPRGLAHAFSFGTKKLHVLIQIHSLLMVSFDFMN